MAKSFLVFIFSSLFLFPILLGLLGTILPAFGFLPAIGMQNFGLWAWQSVLQAPGWWVSAWQSFALGFFTAICSLILAFLLSVSIYEKQHANWLKINLAMLLAMPHLSLAISLEFFFGNHGWLFRFLATFVPNAFLDQLYATPNQLALWLTLIIKETAFLVFVMLGVFSQLKPRQTLVIGKALGYGLWQVWFKVLFLQTYPRIRLSVYAVLVFAIAIVDVAIVIGPTKPSLLAVRVLEWMFHPTKIDNWLLASAGSLFIMLLSLLAIGLIEGLYQLCKLGFIAWSNQGQRSNKNLFFLLVLFFKAICFLCLASVVILVGWSFAKQWSFPSLTPTTFWVDNWVSASPGLPQHLFTSLSLALLASLFSVVLAVYCLELGMHKKRCWVNFVYIPLLLPQVGFLFGIHFGLTWLRLDGYFLTVLWVHLLFVFPYAFLLLNDSYQNFDDRYQKIAAGLGVGRAKFFFQIKLPLISDILLVSLAVGFAVSFAQYLPTLVAGAGRVTSLATEAVALSSSWNRKIISVYALLQTIFPWTIFMLVLAYTFWKKRRGF